MLIIFFQLSYFASLKSRLIVMTYLFLVCFFIWRFNLRYGVDLSNALDQWIEYIDKKGQSLSRYIEDKSEVDFWKGIYRRKERPIDPYSVHVREFLDKFLQDYDLESGLELGPGWGNYTFFLAKRLESLDLVDISPDAINYLKKKAGEKNIDNLNFFVSSFSDFSFQTYDLIFAFNCFYREREIVKFLKNLSTSAKKLVVLGMITSYEPAFNLELRDKYSYNLCGMGNDYVLLMNILYTLGIEANQIILPISRKYTFKNLDQVKSHEIFRINEPYDNSLVDSILLKYLKKEEDGYSLVVDCKAAIIYWHPSEQVSEKKF